MPRIVAPLSVVLVASTIAASAFKDAPYPSVTGGFGEPSCHKCHRDNPVNAPGGSLTIDGMPPSFVPGRMYQITVTLTREGMRCGGFEIAARFVSGKQKGRQAGTWLPTGDRMQLVAGGGGKTLAFVQHNLAGSRLVAAGLNAWTIEWTAPSTASAPVEFDVAASASNDDDSPLGDFIYVQSARSVPGR